MNKVKPVFWGKKRSIFKGSGCSQDGSNCLHALVAKTAMDMPLSNPSEDGVIGIGSVWEDFTLSEFLFWKGRIVSIRLKVRLEVFPRGIPMSV